MNNESISRGPLALFMAMFGDGGIERAFIHLSREWVEHGLQVDLLIGRREQTPLLSQLDPRVNIFDLPGSHPLFSLPALVRYFRRRNPSVFVTDRPRSLVAGVRAKAWARSSAPLWATIHGNLSYALGLEGSRSPKQQRKFQELSRYLPAAQGIVAVSQGVGEDVGRLFPAVSERIRVVYNPVFTPEILDLQEDPVSHPWFADEGPPVILGVGRLVRQKDFPTLLRGFSRLRRRRECRLVVLGKGEDLPSLEALAAQLGIARDVSFPGYVANPFSYMARADLFVLSSEMEGFGNVLVEALAAGTPVVSTDCPYGPREILQDGRFGPLVPVGDDESLARAMEETLENPLPGDALRRRAFDFAASKSARDYLQFFGLDTAPLHGEDSLRCAE